MTRGSAACIRPTRSRRVLLGAHGRCTNELWCGSNYTRGGGGSGASVRDGGASTLIAIVRECTMKGERFALTAAAASVMMHDPIAWHMGGLICWSQGICSGV